MNEKSINENILRGLTVFQTVALEGSFSKAAIKLNVTSSALSHRIKNLENALGIRLLNRTTRALSLTEEGKLLLNGLDKAFDEINSSIQELGLRRNEVHGSLRITIPPSILKSTLWPKLKDVLAKHPLLKIELSTDMRLVDIAAAGFDAGIRLGESLGPDMISVPITPPVRMIAVAKPSYLDKVFGSKRPQHPKELDPSLCIGQRLPSGKLYSWEFENGKESFLLKPEGQIILSQPSDMIPILESGSGIAFILEEEVRELIEAKQLEIILENWCLPFDGFHLYYPSKRHHSKAFQLLVETLRYRS